MLLPSETQAVPMKGHLPFPEVTDDDLYGFAAQAIGKYSDENLASARRCHAALRDGLISARLFVTRLNDLTEGGANAWTLDEVAECFDEMGLHRPFDL